MKIDPLTFSQDLVASFPEFFDEEDDDFPIECNVGWYPLIVILCYQLRESMSTCDTCILDSHPKFAHIKEKWSHLRILMHNTNPTQDLLIRMAEELSCYYCEMCGKTTDTNSKSLGGWHKTLCSDCYKTATIHLNFSQAE